jgi:hypothetical protein
MQKNKEILWCQWCRPSFNMNIQILKLYGNSIQTITKQISRERYARVSFYFFNFNFFTKVIDYYIRLAEHPTPPHMRQSQRTQDKGPHKEKSDKDRGSGKGVKNVFLLHHFAPPPKRSMRFVFYVR